MTSHAHLADMLLVADTAAACGGDAQSQPADATEVVAVTEPVQETDVPTEPPVLAEPVVHYKSR